MWRQGKWDTFMTRVNGHFWAYTIGRLVQYSRIGDHRERHARLHWEIQPERTYLPLGQNHSKTRYLLPLPICFLPLTYFAPLFEPLAAPFRTPCDVQPITQWVSCIRDLFSAVSQRQRGVGTRYLVTSLETLHTAGTAWSCYPSSSAVHPGNRSR